MRSISKYFITAVVVTVGLVAVYHFSGFQSLVVVEDVAQVLENDQLVKQRVTPVSQQQKPRAKLTFDDALQKIIKDDIPGKQSELTATLKKHVNEVVNIIASLKVADNTNKKKLTSQLESKSQELDITREEINRRIDETRRQVSGAEQASLDEFQKKVETRFERLSMLVTAIVQAPSQAELADVLSDAEQYVQTLRKPSFNNEASDLLQPTIKTPSKFDFETPEASPPAYMRAHLSKANQMIASIGGLGTLELALAAPTAPDNEAEGCGYNPEDLSESGPEIIFDERITKLAEQLEFNPLKIYEYVANEIDFQEYYGSLKGAAGTLVSGSGSAMDQASLLSALLRVSKIPTRYVAGQIDFEASDGRGRNWMGVKGDAAFRVVAPLGGIFDNGARYGMTNHVWVQACVPYDNYRGSMADKSGYHWIPLDASFEQYDYVQGEVVPSDFKLNDFLYGADGYMLARTNKLPHEAFEDALSFHIGKPIREAGYTGTKRKIKHDILPSTLPYRVRAFQQWDDEITASETANIPASHRHSLSIAVKNKSGEVLHPTTRFDMPEIALKRITLRFDGASQTQVDNTSCSANPSVTPVIAIEGVDQTTNGKASVGLCSDDNILEMVIHYGLDQTSPRSIVTSTTYRNIAARNYHALQAYALQASEFLIEERSDKMLTTVGQVVDPNTLQDETLGEYLHMVGLKYMGYITQANVRVSALYDGYGVLGRHLGLTSTRKSVDYLFDLPYGITGNGFLIDVGGARAGTFDFTTGNLSYEAFLLASYAASAYESYIWQEMGHLDAVSSVRGIQLAFEVGAPVDVSNDGNSVKPQGNIVYDNWTGSVSIHGVDGGTSGPSSALFAISGEYSGSAGGGYTTGFPVYSGYNSFSSSSYSGSSYSYGGSSTYYSLSSTGSQNLFPDYSSNYIWSDGSNSGSAGSSTSIDFNSAPSNISVGNVGGGYTSWGGDPVNLASGNMYHPEKDFQLKGRGGLNIAFERTYNSHVRKDGPLGYGWTHSFNHQLNFFDTDDNNVTDQVIWVNGSGAASGFDTNGTASGIALNQAFTRTEGMYITAKRESSGEYSIKEKNGLTFYFENIAGVPDSTAKLTRVVDKNGNTLRFAYSGNNLQYVTDDLNRALTFYYDDGNAHITRVVDWSARTYRYGYDARNDLVSYEPPLAISGDEPPTTYAYYVATDGTNLDHAMMSFTRPNGDVMTFEYYTNGKVFRHTDALGKTFTFRYNKFRRETTTVDERGTRQTYLFNEWGQQLEHVQGDGSKRYYEYNDADNPMDETVVRHALGYVTQHEYDATDGDLNKSTLPDGSTLEYFGENTFHQYCTAKDAVGNYTLSRYDNSGNKTQSIALKKSVTLTPTQANDCNYVPPVVNILAWTINTFDSNGNLKTSKRVRDFATQTGPYIEYVYDPSGLNPTTVKRCGMQHDSNDNLVSHCVSGTQVFDSLGRMTTGVGADFYDFSVEYDANGRIERKTDALGEWRDYNYDDSGNLVNTQLLGVGSDGQPGVRVSNTIEYDALNRPISAKNKTGFTRHTQYDEIGNILQVTNPDGYSIRFEYDGMNRPTRAFDEQGHEVKTGYDIGGRPITTTDPNGNATQYEYYGAEENGRLKLVATPDSRTLQYFYDNNGNVIRTVDNMGRENLTDFDSLNRPVRTVGSVHNSYGMSSIRQVTVTEYNELGFVIKIRAGYTADITGEAGSDVLADQATYTYDDFGRQITATDANGKVTRNFYDEHGNFKRTESPNNHIVSYDYDHNRNGLLMTQTAKLSATDPAPHITRYEYNVLGQMTKVIAPEVTYVYGYDVANRLTTVTDSRGNKVLTYDYSPGGLLNFVADSDGKRTDFLYDAASRLTAMLAANDDRVNFIFDAGGRLRETSIPNGLKAQYTYDAGNNLLSRKNSTNVGIVSQHDYTYDAAGRRETHLENIAGTSTAYKYEYDNLDRTTAIKKDGGLTLVEEYQYDQFNNRRTRHPNGGSTYFYQYDAVQQLNQILTGSDTGTLVASFTYDDKGNLTFKSEGGVTRTFIYNALDRLTQVTGSDISTETYTYDYQGRRIEKNVGGATNRYTYSGMSIWAEFGATWGEALAYYNYTGVDQAVIRSTPISANTRYYHKDGLGSAVAVSNAAGAIQASAGYDSWGKVISGGGVPQFGFTGREPDATGLMYFRARYYDPSMGRFTQRDPIGFAGGLNPYTYVGNSPQNFTDPLGLAAATPNIGMNTSTAMAGNSSAVSAQGNVYTGANATLSAAYDDCLSCHGAGSFNGNFESDEFQQNMALGVTATAYTMGIGIAAEALGATGGALLMMAVTGEPGSISRPNIGYHATSPGAAQSITQSGFQAGTRPGRLGSGGTYVNNTPAGAIDEFAYHSPGVTPSVIRVEYNQGVNASAVIPPRNYVGQHPLNVESISAPSIRAPGTVNTNILNGSATPVGILP